MMRPRGSEQRHLTGLRHLAEGAEGAQRLNMRLADLGAGRADVLQRDEAQPALARGGQVVRRGLAETGDGDEGGAKLMGAKEKPRM